MSIIDDVKLRNSAQDFVNDLDDINIRFKIFDENNPDDLCYLNQAVDHLAKMSLDFQKHFQGISSSPDLVQICLRCYQQLTHKVYKYSVKDDQSTLTKTLKTALQVLQPEMTKLAFYHPSIAEAQILSDPQIFYECPEFLLEQLFYLDKKDYLFYLARCLEWYCTDHDLPSILCKLHPFLKDLEKPELIQLGVLINQERSRREFSKKYGLDETNLEYQRKAFLENFNQMRELVGNGVCSAAAIYFASQDIPDPNRIDWRELRRMQNLFEKCYDLGMRGYLAKIFEQFEVANPNYRNDYPNLMNYASLILGYKDFETYNRDSGDLHFKKLGRIVFGILSKNPSQIEITADKRDAIKQECLKLKNTAIYNSIAAKPLSEIDRYTLGIPSWLLKKLKLFSPELVFQNQSTNIPLTKLLKTHQNGRFIVIIEDHSFVFSLQERWFCDTNDYDIVTQKIRVRQYSSNEELLQQLQRYIRLRYPKVSRFSLFKIDRRLY